MKQIKLGHIDGNPSTSSTQYFNPFDSRDGNFDFALSTTESARSVNAGMAGTIRNFSITLSVAPGVGKSRSFTFMKNGSAQSLTLTVSGTNTTASDSSNSFTVSATDTISIRTVPSGTPTDPDRIRYSWEFEGNNTGENVVGLMGSPSNTLTQYYALAGEPAGGTNTAQNKTVFPHAATIKAMYVRLSASPGAGNNLVFSVFKNGAEEASSIVTIADAATTGSITGLSISMSAGDVGQIQVAPNSGPTTDKFNLCILLESNTDGESILATTTGNDTLTTGTANYFLAVNDGRAVDGSTESDFTLEAGLVAFEVKNLYVLLEGSAGASKNYTFTMRKSGADQSLAATVSDAGTTANDTTHTVSVGTADTLNWKFTALGTPTARTANISITQYIAGGATYNATASDVVSATDSFSRVVASVRLQADSATVTDSLSKQSNQYIANSDSVNTTDSIFKSSGFNRPLSDLVQALDSIAYTLLSIIERSISDSVTVSDAISKVSQNNQNIADLVTATDNISRQLSSYRDLAELVNITDSLVYTFSGIILAYIADSVTATDSIAKVTSSLRNLTDSVNVDDDFLYQLFTIILASVYDQVSATDSVSKSSGTNRNQSDSINVADVINFITQVSINIYDSVGVSDSATRAFAAARLAQDGVNAADYVTVLYQNASDGSPGPTIESVIFTPLPYTEPDKIVIYSLPNVDTGFVTSGKIYDSHTVYNKHIPYYGYPPQGDEPPESY